MLIYVKQEEIAGCSSGGGERAFIVSRVEKAAGIVPMSSVFIEK